MGTGDLEKLNGGFAGEIVRPDDPGYDAARAVWNSMIDRRPALIVRPTGTDDVVAALRFAREQELVIAVRCMTNRVNDRSDLLRLLRPDDRDDPRLLDGRGDALPPFAHRPIHPPSTTSR